MNEKHIAALKDRLAQGDTYNAALVVCVWVGVLTRDKATTPLIDLAAFRKDPGKVTRALVLAIDPEIDDSYAAEVGAQVVDILDRASRGEDVSTPPVRPSGPLPAPVAAAAAPLADDSAPDDGDDDGDEDEDYDPTAHMDDNGGASDDNDDARA